jgi:hypothetical protein
MRHRFSVSVSAAALIVGSASLASVVVTGQSRSAGAPAAKKSTPPLTAWGKPDLEGVWDFRTVTPLERPSDLAGKEVLTAAEAAALEEQAARNRVDRAPRAGNPGTYNQFWFDFGTDVVETKRTSLIIDPPDGRLPALTAEAQKRKAADEEARRGIEQDEPTPGDWVHDLGPGGLRVRCLVGFNSGPPMTPNAYNNNVQLFQTPEYLVILNEMITTRVIPLDGRPHGHIRQWAGDSRGRWEGNTLVVDSINFRGATIPYGWFTIGSTPEFSANMRLVERFTRTDADTLLYEFTVEEPRTWIRPWTAQVPMKKSAQPMYEYACHEGNYSLHNILSGALGREAPPNPAKK